MKKAIVFGATSSGKEVYDEILKEYDIVAFCDNDSKKWNGELLERSIISPSKIKEYEFDDIIIISLSARDSIVQQLVDMNIQRNVINTRYVDLMIEARRTFLRDFSQLVYSQGLLGNVAEAGVFQGEFAKEINRAFPDRKLYLFDTFEGFDSRDVEEEKLNGYSNSEVGHLNITSEELVLSKMPFVENCLIYKGYFPESAREVNDQFVFVSLDFDLFRPTLAGLRFFWEKLCIGGIVVIHDYFGNGYLGIKEAVNIFIQEYKCYPFPIGDHVSVAFIKGSARL